MTTFHAAAFYLLYVGSMRSKKVEFWMPWPAYDEAERRRKLEGYRSIGRYFMALVMRDASEIRRHKFLQHVANLDPQEQDEMLDLLLSADADEMRRLLMKGKHEEVNK